MTTGGVVTFENAAVAAGVATPPAEYVMTWSRFDNTIGAPAGESVQRRVTEPRAVAPPALIGEAEFISVKVETIHSDFPHWQLPVILTFRRETGGWQAVGLERSVPPRRP
jgi:hypothetical protein